MKPSGPPYVEIFDWPSRFFVEGESPDRAIIDYFDDYTIYPYLVDLDDKEFGAACSCYDFRVACQEDGRKECKHIIYARRYKNLIGHNPKPIPKELF